MLHTLIAVFDNRSDAQGAMNELLAAGFDSSTLRLSEESAAKDMSASSITGATPGAGADAGASEGMGASIKHFFTDLFSDDTDTAHRQKYTTALDRGHHALTVTASSEEEVERAADIVEGFGPVDIDEKSAQWGGQPGMGSAAAYSAGAGNAQGAGLSGSQQLGTGAAAGGAQSAGASGSQQFNTGTTATAPGSDPGANTSGAQQYDMGTATAATGNVQGGSLAGSQQRDTGTDAAIPVVQEQLKVGKREVQRGGVRVYSRIVETPVQENIGLREEHVQVERRPVDQQIDPAAATAFKEQSIELRETAEEAVVQKTARVVEEVVVSKDVTQREETISDTVRHTEVEVEHLGTQPANDATGFSAQTGIDDPAWSPQTASDDTAYRSHWTSNYATSGTPYEQYAPAYSYGSTMAGQYRGRQWNDVESDMRTQWEARNSGSPSTWEQFKGAIRQGWDNVTK
ncbi:MAG TPA: DUF2382 domain-containing protein [Telluria sp.]